MATARSAPASKKPMAAGISATRPAARKTTASKAGVKAAVKPASAAADGPKSPAPRRNVAAERLPQKARKPKKLKLDYSLTAPQSRTLEAIKQSCIAAGMAIKKTELLGLGILLLQDLSVAELKNAAAKSLKTKPPRAPKGK